MATTSRFPSGAANDNTDRILNNEYLEPAYAASIALTPTKAYTLVKPATLTGNVSLTIGVGSSTTPPHVGDELEIIWTPDGSTRTVTYSTGTLPSVSTQAITTAKVATIKFVFTGAAWLETSRSISA